ncbi:sugar nucleotide-binding protein [Bradyrhizobium sp. STM 3561]|uniref:sugar nucleotide-binding protein n=1 Tax=Bradyrhizobium sp. STM 3561 TaxID=578923 RepID=UPI00388DDA5C
MGREGIEENGRLDRPMRDYQRSRLRGGGSGRELERAISINRDGAARLANVANETFHFLYVSTDYVFDGAKHDAYDKTDIAAQLNAYGAALPAKPPSWRCIRL